MHVFINVKSILNCECTQQLPSSFVAATGLVSGFCAAGGLVGGLRALGGSIFSLVPCVSVCA